MDIVEGRIEDQDIECIVNSTNAELTWEETTVNGDILRKAGQGLIREFERRHREYGDLNVGDLFITPGYCAPASLICHVYSPWFGYDQYLNRLTRLYLDIFYKLSSIGIKHVALPLLGTGAFMIPKGESLASLKTAEKYSHGMKEIILVVLNKEGL